MSIAHGSVRSEVSPTGAGVGWRMKCRWKPRARMMTRTNPQAAVHPVELALLALLATLWGASYTFIKLGVATIPPVTLIAARTLIAGMLLLTIMRWRGLCLPRDGTISQRFLFQACLNSVVPFTLIAWAERSLDAGLATILNSTSPIFTFLLTIAVTRHEPVTARKLFGVIAGLAGICLIVGVQTLSGLGEQLLAQIATVVATVCYAGAAIFGRGFKGLDRWCRPPARCFVGGRDSHSNQSPGRPALEIGAVAGIDSGAACSVGIFHRVGFGDLLPVDPDAGFGGDHGAGLFAGADRSGARWGFARRKPQCDGMGGIGWRRHRCRRDDNSV